MPTAAFGFGSKVSRWDGPPASQIKMQFFTFGELEPEPVAARERSRNHSSSPNPRKPSEPTRRTSRRLGPPHR
jgi:hypothetical protein